MASKLAQMQARFQQKQMQEKEEKLLKLYENQQQRTIERVSRGSAGSDSIVTTTTTTANLTAIHGGKVRQMFDERRQKAGIDRSYPLEPLKTKANTVSKAKPDKNKNLITRSLVKSTAVQKSLKSTRNGNLAVNQREVIESVYTNENGNENYEQERQYYENKASDAITKDNDIISLMNNHNLNDNIDDEEMPHVGLDEVDEPMFIGKLSNVGGISSSQNEINQRSEQKVDNASRPTRKFTTPVTQQRKPVLQKTPNTKPQQQSPKRTAITTTKAPAHSGPTTRNSPTSPSKTMSSKRPNQDRVPSTNRPSARQTPRGPPSTVTRDDLTTCKFCNRRFAPDRLQVHEDICARTAKKKRKAYDALKHRVQGTELEPFAKKAVKAGAKGGKSPSAKKSNWRQTHDEFISTIRAAKMTQAHLAKGGKLSDLPPPPPSTNPDYVQCPHCGRRFNETAAARHIPKCATYDFNKAKSQPSRPGQKVSGRAIK